MCETCILMGMCIHVRVCVRDWELVFLCSQMIFQKEIRVQHFVCSILALPYLFHRINPRWRFFYIRVFPHFFWGQAQPVEVYERGPVIIEAEQFGIGAVSFITVCIMPATICSEDKVSALNTASFSSGLKVHYQPPCPSHRENSCILFKVAFCGHFHQVALALHHRLLVVFGRHDDQYRFLAHETPQLTKKTREPELQTKKIGVGKKRSRFPIRIKDFFDLIRS